MREQVFQFNVRMGVESEELGKATKARRGKSIFYVRHLQFAHNPRKRIQTHEEEVSQDSEKCLRFMDKG